MNAIPEALADAMGRWLNWPVDIGVVQTNIVAHTKSDGYGRLARQPTFEGDIRVGDVYVMVDDFIGMGGTLANLRGYIEANQGSVLAAFVLTGEPKSTYLKLSTKTLAELRSKHGTDLEQWWKQRFGHAFDALTESEAGYLLRREDADYIRNRIIAAQQERNR